MTLRIFLKALFNIMSEDLLQDFYCAGYTETKICKDCDHEVKKSIKKRSSMFYINNAESIQESCNNRFRENIPGYECPGCKKKGEENKNGCINKIEFNSKNIVLFLSNPTLMRDMKIDSNIRCIVNSKMYSLKSIAVHSGNETSGHYTALVNKDNKWYVCNDSKVTLLIGDIQQYLSSSNVKLIVYSQIDIVKPESNIKTMLLEDFNRIQEKLQDDFNRIQENFATLFKELYTKYVKAIDENDSYEKMQIYIEKDAFYKEKDQLYKEKDRFYIERDTFYKENEKGKDKFYKEKDQFYIERDMFYKKKEKLEKEKRTYRKGKGKGKVSKRKNRNGTVNKRKDRKGKVGKGERNVRKGKVSKRKN